MASSTSWCALATISSVDGEFARIDRAHRRMSASPGDFRQVEVPDDIGEPMPGADEIHVEQGQARRAEDAGGGVGDPLRVETLRHLLGGASDHPRAQTSTIFEQFDRRRLHFPDHAQKPKKRQQVVGGIILPPPEPLTGAALVGVVIIVPALAHCNKREKAVVSRIVSGDEALSAGDMGERIDAERRVVDRDRAPEEADHQALPSVRRKACERENDRGRHFEPMQPHQLWKPGEVADPGQIGLAVATIENPADVAVQEPALPRRVNVLRRVGMQVMLPMLGRPPQRAPLGGRLRKKGQRELERPAGFIGAMGEVAVIAGADGEDPEPVQADADRQSRPAHSGPDGAEAGQVRQGERNRRRINNVRGGLGTLEVFGGGAWHRGRSVKKATDFRSFSGTAVERRRSHGLSGRPVRVSPGSVTSSFGVSRT